METFDVMTQGKRLFGGKIHSKNGFEP